MAYFDSEKNRAIWDKRLTQLSAEKLRRQTEGYKPSEAGDVGPVQEAVKAETSKIRIISFEQLVEKEQNRHKAKMQQQKKERTPEMAPARSAKVL